MLRARCAMPGFTRILRDAKEAFRDAPAHSIPLRQACTKPQPGSAAAVSPSQNADPSRRRPGGKAAGALGLKEFMHRTRVLDLYRGILKRARALEDKDVAAQARRRFQEARDETDPLAIKMLVAEAANYLEALQGSTRAGAAGGVSGGDSWLDIDDPEDERGRVGEGFPWQR